ncbi:hypothetical protein, partial [Alloalcanivorax gelatiniphagus]
GRGGAAARTGLTALAVVGLGLVWHRVFGALLTPLPGDQATTAQIVWITALFVALLVLQARLRAGHHDQRLHRALANGLYLDQWINRLPGLHRFGGQRPATPAWREQEHTS